ncbi:unnamed protein product, partial [Vitis vinifera]
MILISSLYRITSSIINHQLLQSTLTNQFNELELAIFQMQTLKTISLQYELIQIDLFNTNTL